MVQRTRSALLAVAVMVAALAVAVSGCGATPALRPGASPVAGSGSSAPTGPAANPAGARGAVPAAVRQVRCPAVSAPALGQPGAAGPAEPIPAGFRPAAVVECVTITSVRHGVVRTEQRRQAAVTGLGGLLAALREPASRAKGPLPACIVPAAAVPWFVLVGVDGQAVRPAVPASLCGEPIDPVLASLHSLRWITLGTVILPPVPARPPLHGGPAHVVKPPRRPDSRGPRATASGRAASPAW